MSRWSEKSAVAVGVQRPVERRQDHVCRSLAAEDPQRVQRGLRRHARADPTSSERACAQRAVAAGERLAVSGHAVSRGGARHVACRAPRSPAGSGRGAGPAVRRRSGRVVAVADEVVAADDLGGRVSRAAAGSRRGVRRLVRRRRARATEVGVGVVDAGVDDADPDALAGDPGLLPGGQRLDQLAGRGVVDVFGVIGVILTTSERLATSRSARTVAVMPSPGTELVVVNRCRALESVFLA